MSANAVKQIRAVIVDDDSLARSGLRKFCDETPDLQIVGECPDGRSALQVIEDENPQLLFLDVEMHEMNGFDLLAQLDGESLPYVIFTTAHDDYALGAFEFEAVDFLLKPFDKRRFDRAVERVRRRMASAAPDALRDELSEVLQALPELRASALGTRYLRRLAVRQGQRTSFIDASEIDCIEARRNYVDLHAGTARHELHTALRTLEQKLDPRRFLRIHRSLVINMERVEEIQNWFNGCFRFKLANGATVTSGRAYRKGIQSFLNNDLS